jgi:hypothetical protein
MPSNFKRMVRERMAETGESWQTAARKVRARAEPVIQQTSDDEEVTNLLEERGDLTVLRPGDPTLGRRFTPPVVVDARSRNHNPDGLQDWIRSSVLTRFGSDADMARRPLVVVWTR